MPIFRYLSVSELKLRRRSEPAMRIDAVGVEYTDISIAAQSDRLKIFRSHHRADAAAAGMTTFVADRGEAHAIFSRCADGRHSNRRRVQLGFDRRFGLAGTFPSQVFGLANLDLFIADEEVNREAALAGDDDSIDADRFSSRAKWLEESESPMKPVSGDLVTTPNLAVVVRPVPTSGALVKISGLAGEKGSTPRRRVVVEQARAEADAAKERAEARFL